MAFTKKRKIYESLPLAIQQSVCLIPFSWWAGRAYRKTYRRGPWFDRASRAELLAYQEHQLGKILDFATHRVPVYRYLRSTVGRFRPFDALKEFPLVDKDTLRANLPNHLACDWRTMPHYEAATGGTSGDPLKVYLDDQSQSIEMGFCHRFWSRMHYRSRSRKATFRGVSFTNLARGVFWQRNPIYHALQFSPFHMSGDNLPAYLQQFICYQPEYLHGYPSAIDTLAQYILRCDLSSRLPTIKAAFLCSEGCSTMQRQRIEQAFRTRVFSWYGHTERVIFGGECERNSTYHHFPDYGILEIIDDEGNSCSRDGERGELVGTGLNNYCMPLIRYRTGDYATRLESQCECGRDWDRFTDVEDHWGQDMLIGRSGLGISVKRYSGPALKSVASRFDRIVRCQYHQDGVGECVLKVMVAPEFTEQDRLAIERAYNENVGNEIRFTVQVVSHIPLTARGKLKLLDSRLSVEQVRRQRVRPQCKLHRELSAP